VFVDDLCDGGGDVVNVSSVAGRKAGPMNNVYASLIAYAVTAPERVSLNECWSRRARSSDPASHARAA
jgi:hypothetical protein